MTTAILEAKTFNEAIRGGNLNPFDQPKIILCSYQFPRSKEPYLRQTAWDLVVIDEAHRLRNVYKTSNKIAVAIKSALAGRQKVLLTATPLQNSLLELYGLVSIVDEFIFGDLRSFRAQFTRASATKTSFTDEEEYSSLRERIRLFASAPFVDRLASTLPSPVAMLSCRSLCRPPKSSGSTSSYPIICRVPIYMHCLRASANS